MVAQMSSLVSSLDVLTPSDAQACYWRTIYDVASYCSVSIEGRIVRQVGTPPNIENDLFNGFLIESLNE